MSEPIEDDGTEVNFGHLTLKVSGAEAFSQTFGATHFSLNARAPMITTEALSGSGYEPDNSVPQTRP